MMCKKLRILAFAMTFAINLHALSDQLSSVLHATKSSDTIYLLNKNTDQSCTLPQDIVNALLWCSQATEEPPVALANICDALNRNQHAIKTSLLTDAIDAARDIATALNNQEIAELLSDYLSDINAKSATYKAVKSNGRFNNLDVVNRLRVGSLSVTSDVAIGGNLTIVGVIQGNSGAVVAGPSTSTNNAIARWSGTSGDLLKNSTPLVLDDGRISTLTDPVDNQDAATKKYVNEVGRLHGKKAVRMVAVSNVSFDGTSPPNGITFGGAPIVIDSITVAVDDRVLLVAQGGGASVYNGIWVAATGNWTRPSDFDTGSAAASDFTTAQEGTNYANTSWMCTNTPPNDIVDTNALAWVQFAATGVFNLLPVDTNGSPNGDGAFLTNSLAFNLNSADATNPGIVNYHPTNTQTFGGAKTFAQLLTASSGLTVTGTTGITGATTITGVTAINTSGGATTTIGSTGSGGVVEVNSNSTITIDSAAAAADAVKIEASTSNASTTLHLVSQGTGITAINVDSAGGIDMDSAGIFSINSSGNVINIGDDNVNQNINIGSGGQRTITIGSTGLANSTIKLQSNLVSFTWPTTDGAANTAIITDGAGTLSFSANPLGDVSGPNSATPQAIAIFSGSGGKTIKNSVVTIADGTGDMAGVGAFTSNGTASINSSSAQTTSIGLGGGTITVGVAGSSTTGINGTTTNINTTAGATNCGNTTGATTINGSTTTINSSSGALSIGIANNTQSINIGTQGGRTITVGTNGNTSNRLILNSGSTNGIEINDDVNSPTKINSGSSTSTVDIGTRSNTGAVTIGSSVSVNLACSTAGVLINNSVSGPTKINTNSTGSASSTVDIGHITSDGAINIDSNNIIEVDCDGANGVRINETGTGPTRINGGSETGALLLGNSNTSSISMQTDGDIGIGTDNQPGDINIGTNSAGSRTITIGGTGQGNSVHLNAGGGGSATFKFIGVVGASGTQLQLSGNTVVQNASSRRYKQNIVSTVNSECIYDLKAVEYELKKNLCTGPAKRLYGWIAEEVDLVSTNLTNYNLEGEPDGVRYEDAVVLVIEELKKLKGNQTEVRHNGHAMAADLKAQQDERLEDIVKKMEQDQKVLAAEIKSMSLYIAMLEQTVTELKKKPRD